MMKRYSSNRNGVNKLLFAVIILAFAVLAVSLLASACGSDDSCAAGENEAKIGTHEYLTFSEAYADASDGDTIDLLKSAASSNCVR